MFIKLFLDSKLMKSNGYITLNFQTQLFEGNNAQITGGNVSLDILKSVDTFTEGKYYNSDLQEIA